MASHEAYLRTALTKYTYADIAKRDILNAFQTFKDLRPSLEAFVFNDGTNKELLCLDGTIPVTYKGTIYNIPLLLWLLESHPYNPPMVYIKPTLTMQIKPGRHVDSNGKVFLPYMHDWRHPQSDLFGLIQVLTVVFGDEPPVFAKTSNQPPSRPVYPPGGQPSSNLPYPSAGGGMPVPGYPPVSGYPPQRPPASGYPPQQPPATGYSGYPPQQPNAAYPNSYSTPPYPSHQSYAAQTSTAGHQDLSRQNTLPLSHEQIRASLLSAVEDKMRRRLKEIYSQAQAEMDALKKTNDDLQKGRHTLDDMLQRLEREQNEVEKNITLLQEKDQEMEEVISKMENREELDIDNAVVPAAPLYRQLLNVFAEEQATEDALYYLGEALRKSAIPLESFLKQVREVSRQQFMLRALVLRCRQKAGLPDLTL